MAATTQERPMDLERPIMQIGTDLAARMPRPRAVSTARVERRMTGDADEATPRCARRCSASSTCARRARRPPTSPATCTSCWPTPTSPATPAAPPSITGRKLAHAARSPRSPPPASSRWRSASSSAPTPRTRCPTITTLWKNGVDDDRRPARRGHRLRGRGRPLHAALRGRPCARSPPPPRKYPDREVNLPSRSPRSRRCCAPTAPERGIEGARPRLRHLLRVARDVGAHLHVDMESFDTREAITRSRSTCCPSPSSPTARPPASSCRPTSSTRPSTSTSCSTGPRARRASTRSRSAWSRAPTGTTRSSRPPRTAGRRRSSPTAASATATSSCSPSA